MLALILGVLIFIVVVAFILPGFVTMLLVIFGGKSGDFSHRKNDRR